MTKTDETAEIILCKRWDIWLDGRETRLYYDVCEIKYQLLKMMIQYKLQCNTYIAVTRIVYDDNSTTSPISVWCSADIYMLCQSRDYALARYMRSCRFTLYIWTEADNWIVDTSITSSLKQILHYFVEPRLIIPDFCIVFLKELSAVVGRSSASSIKNFFTSWQFVKKHQSSNWTVHKLGTVILLYSERPTSRMWSIQCSNSTFVMFLCSCTDTTMSMVSAVLLCSLYSANNGLYMHLYCIHLGWSLVNKTC